MQVPEPSMQHRVMIEAVENHMPEVVIGDEIGTEVEALTCRSNAERGVVLIATAHGERLENVVKNPSLCDLVRVHGSFLIIEVAIVLFPFVLISQKIKMNVNVA